MDKERHINMIQAVINTLNGATVRADQVDVVQRIAACVRELNILIEDLNVPEKTEE